MKKILFALSIVLGTTLVAQDRSIRPEAGPAPEIQLGSTESFVMDNGLKVFVVENHKLPKVSISLQFKYQPELEGDAVGISSITGDLLGTKTATRSKDEIDASIDYIGASLSTSSSGIYASSLTKHLPTLLNLFSDVLLNSEFTQEEFDKSITQNISGLANASDSPDAIAGNVNSVLNFGTAHTFGELMTEESLANITLDNCKDFYQTYFSPKGSYLAIVGDISLAEAKEMTAKYLENWKATEFVNATYTGLDAPNENKVSLVNKAGAVQSIINITYPLNLSPSSDDALKVKVMNNILGGGSSARLFLNLREDKAYTYGAYSSINVDPVGSYFNASAKVRNEVTDSAIVEFFTEINTLRNEKVSQEELQGVLNNMSGKFAIALESASTVARFAINTDYLGLEADHYANYLKKLSEITVDDIYQVAQKYLKPNNAHIIVVGDADNLIAKLAVFGDVTLRDTYGNEKSDLRAVETGVTAKTIIADYIDAIGGEKKLNKLTSVQFNYAASIPGAPAKLKIEILKQVPNSFSMTMKMMGMTVQRQFSNGNGGFNDGMQGAGEMTEDELLKSTNEFKIASELNYFDDYTAEVKGIDILDSEDVYVVIRTDKEGAKATEYYSVATKFLVKSESSVETPEGEVSQTTLYKDYQSVKGYSFPHQTIQNVAGQSIDMKLKKVVVNKNINASKFE
jgi:predicted Zn-dependent peptidase